MIRPSGDFNTSPSTRGFAIRADRYELPGISIPAPPRGASTFEIASPRDVIFQYQPLHEGLPYSASEMLPSAVFQYQPLHEGLPKTGISVKVGSISIPAPPRGASSGVHYDISNLSISIPAPPRGASEEPTTDVAVPAFQYQPLHEGLPGERKCLHDGRISIPAPPRGASW